MLSCNNQVLLMIVEIICKDCGTINYCTIDVVRDGDFMVQKLVNFQTNGGLPTNMLL